MNNRILSIGILVIIILLAFFKYWISGWFASAINDIVKLFGGDVDTFHKTVIALTNGQWKAHKAGYFLYYPFYISFHLLFIYYLFENRKVKFWLMMVVVVIITTLILLSIVAALMEMEMLRYVSYKLFSKLFGLPFILLAIEGGRILYGDVQKRLESHT